MNGTGSTHDLSAPSGEMDEAGVLAELGATLLADRPMSDVLEEMTMLAKQVLPETPEISLTLLEGDHAETAAFTGKIALELDERQYDKGYGPCLDAAASGETINLVMADPDGPYPDFARAALQQGVTHLLSVGLAVTTPTVGALNIYSSTGHPFGADARRIAGVFATVAGLVLVKAGLGQDLRDLAGHLEAAVRSRAVIDQAKGVIMAQNRCSADAAFQILVRASQNQGVKLARLAAQLVDGVATT
jgi:transcriptional regulator with GAF, ATPase, and Fis domain